MRKYHIVENGKVKETIESTETPWAQWDIHLELAEHFKTKVELWCDLKLISQYDQRPMEARGE